jgi:threonine dehydratase
VETKHQPSHCDSADAGRHTKTAACGDKSQKQCCDGTAERKPTKNQWIGLNRYTKKSLLIINTRLMKMTTRSLRSRKALEETEEATEIL